MYRFLYFQNSLRKETKIAVEKNFRSFDFVNIKNIIFGYILCHLENHFTSLYVCFKIMTRKKVTFPKNLDVERHHSEN